MAQISKNYTLTLDTYHYIPPCVVHQAGNSKLVSLCQGLDDFCYGWILQQTLARMFEGRRRRRVTDKNNALLDKSDVILKTVNVMYIILLGGLCRC